MSKVYMSWFYFFFQFDEHSDAAAETKLKKGIIKLFLSQM